MSSDALNSWWCLTCCGGGPSEAIAALYAFDDLKIPTRNNDGRSHGGSSGGGGDGGSSRGRSPTRRRCINASFDMESDDGAREGIDDNRHNKKSGNQLSEAAFTTTTTTTMEQQMLDNNYWPLVANTLFRAPPKVHDTPNTTAKYQLEQMKRSRSGNSHQHRKHHVVPWTRGTFRRGRSRPAVEKQGEHFLDEEDIEDIEDARDDDAPSQDPPSPLGLTMMTLTTTMTNGIIDRSSGIGVGSRVISTSISRSSSRLFGGRRGRSSSNLSRICTSVTTMSADERSSSSSHKSSKLSTSKEKPKNGTKMKNLSTGGDMIDLSPADEIIALTKTGRHNKAGFESSSPSLLNNKKPTTMLAQRRSVLLQKIPHHLARVGRSRAHEWTATKKKMTTKSKAE
jgi:hypothetical protein